MFYHRILKCHVLIELKPKKLNYKDIAQLSLYMSYYRKNKMTAGDNPPIGILMCTGVGKETVEYLSPFIDPQLFLSEYQLQPTNFLSCAPAPHALRLNSWLRSLVNQV